MLGDVTGMGLFGGLTVETTLDPAKQPFLFDHQINQTPVLPGVMGVEAMAEAAKLLFPDRFIGVVEDVRFLSPFKFYRSQPRAVIVQANFYAESDDIIAECRLLGSRTLHGQSEPEVTTHFTGRVRLVAVQPQAAKEALAPGLSRGLKADGSQVYRIFFHGPAYQVIDSAWRKNEQVIGLFAKDLPANHMPAELPLLVFPRFIEMGFQTASLTGLTLQSRLGLPDAFQELRITASPEKEPNETFFALVTSNPDGSYDAKIVDGKGNVYLILRGYRTMNLPDPIPADLLAPLQNALIAKA
jgi:hypothetical protein